MPKISDVFPKRLSPLKQKVYDYLNKHPDEVFSYVDAKELAQLIGHENENSVGYALWGLHREGLIPKERVGIRVYFGSHQAIEELRKRKKQK